MDKIIYSAKPDMDKLPGGWEPSKNMEQLTGGYAQAFCIGYLTYVIDNFLSNEDCDKILSFMKDAPRMEKVSVQGMMDETNMEIGSHRTTTWSPSLAEEMWKLLNQLNPKIVGKHVFGKFSPTDWWQGEVSDWWEPVAFSPMMRFMRYEANGQHYPHYDAGYIYKDNKYRSLMSVVLYLTDNDSGSTRFIEDNQSMIPIDRRNHNDWERAANSNEVINKVNPKKGRILIFPHRACHDVDKYLGENGARIIIRTDLIYKAL